MWHHIFTLHLSGGNPILDLMSMLIWKKCRILYVRDHSPLCERNRCEESETREEEILKALEHHQTGKTPTHNRAEKALRSSQASLNGSLSANCTTQPPSEWHYFFSPPKSTWALRIRVGERTLFLSDLLILRQVIHPLSAVISTFCLTSPRPVPLSSESWLSCKTHQKETLHMESKREINTQLFGWEDSGFWLQIGIASLKQFEELYKTVKLLCVTACVYQRLHYFILSLIVMKIQLPLWKHQEEVNLPVS